MERKLKYSFCGKDETQVAKLIAGGRKNIFGSSTYICDECVSIAHAIISNPEPPVPAAAAQRTYGNKKPIRAVGSAGKPVRLGMAAKA